MEKMKIYRSPAELSLQTFYSSGFSESTWWYKESIYLRVIFVRDFRTDANGGILGKIKFMKIKI